MRMNEKIYTIFHFHKLRSRRFLVEFYYQLRAQPMIAYNSRPSAPALDNRARSAYVPTA